MPSQYNLARIASASDKLGGVIEKVTGAFCVLVFAIMTAVTLFGVFFRYVMQNPFQWTEELARYLMIWMVFIGINIALRKEEHIKIPLLAERVPPFAAKVMGYTVDLMVAYFLIILLKQGYLMTINTGMTASTMHFSMHWIFMAVPMAAFLTLIQLLLNLISKIASDFSLKTDTKI